MMYLLAALAIGAGALALYERRKNRRITLDLQADPTRNRDRVAYTDAEKLRAEILITQMPHGGGIF